MKRKKIRRKAMQNSLEKNVITEEIRKSMLTASNEYDFKKLCRFQEGFLNCTIKEDGESMIFTYDIQNMLPWSCIKQEKREMTMLVLADVGRLQKAAEIYCFSLYPDNLYYDIQGRVYVKTRDIYCAESGYSEERFLVEYRSLIGCTLVKKYKFEDYDKGGMDLLRENKFLSQILECTDVNQTLDKMHEEYFRYKKDHQKRFMEVSKAKHRGNKIALVISSILLVAAVGLLGWQLLWERPYEEAVIEANESYLKSDYNGTVEAMASVGVERMDIYQKYILSYSCIRCESFSDETMKNILNTISLNGDEKVMEYWIYINRLDTEAAADIAMQESSNQLLFYAYLKEKALVEKDTTLSGQEKNSRLSDLENKLKPLEEEFSVLTGE